MNLRPLVNQHYWVNDLGTYLWGPGESIRTEQEDREMRQLQSKFDAYDQGDGGALSRKEENRLRKLQGKQQLTAEMNMNQSQVIAENRRRENIRTSMNRSAPAPESAPVPSPKPTQTVTRQLPQQVVYRQAPAPAAPPKPVGPQYKKSASGRYVMAGGKQSKASPKLGRGRRSTIVTGDLGEGPQIKKPKLGD